MEDGKKAYLSQLYNQIADELNISDTMTEKAMKSYNAVGTWLGDCEPGLDIKIMPQGSFNLGTVIKPLSDTDEYDIDLVCLLKNGSSLSEADIKNIVGKRLKEHGNYKKMLDEEGKRCWTLNYDEFHMDILPSVPLSGIFIEPNSTQIKLTHKLEADIYIPKYSNPYKYHLWFEERMKTILINEKKNYAFRNQVEIDKVADYKVKTPLQKAIQLLKRHRDIMFQEIDGEDAPISIIITTLAALSYNNETNLYDTITNIIQKMPSYIQKEATGQYTIKNPVMPEENFADKWNENVNKVVCFKKWINKASEDIINNPLSIYGSVEVSEIMKNSFGKNITERAYNAIGERTKSERENQKLYINGLQGGITYEPTKVSKTIGGHTFFGK
jgi:hypothetical protein